MYRKGDWCRWHRETGDAAVLNGRITEVLDDGDWYTVENDPTPRKAWATISCVKGRAFSAFEGDLIVVHRRPYLAICDEAIAPIPRDEQGNVKWSKSPIAADCGRRIERPRPAYGPSIDELIEAGRLPEPTLWQRLCNFFKGL